MTPSLHVYKASAGSGKTFTLAVEYIKLLVVNPLSYKHILAVTFTNKATAEMKERILTKLCGIAKNAPDGDDYLKKLLDDKDVRTALAQQTGSWKQDDLKRTTRERANMALYYIMHDYSHFRITTIDSFFQSIIRELAHELNLTANLRVDMNDDEVLAEAVGTLINDLQEQSDVFNWLLSYAESLIENGKNWKMQRELTKFGKNIFNEQFIDNSIEHRNQMLDMKKLGLFKRTIKETGEQAEKDRREKAQRFMNICGERGFTSDDFVGKTQGIWNFMRKLAEEEKIPDWGKTGGSALNNMDKWLKKPSETALIEQFMKMLSDIRKDYLIIATSSIISGHINNMGLLGEINKTVRTLNAEANRFLLSDTAHFLRDMIADSDVPFIYERTGTTFHHIMIDEFQDTSRMQWDNFRPLLANSLAAQSSCLIVGDVKQSIYRWRNSDWSILNNIEQSEFRNHIKTDSLDTNYRSAGNVINFNNHFFIQAIQLLNDEYKAKNNGDNCEDILHAYSDVEQKIKPEHVGKGYVSVELIDEKGNENEGDELQDYTEITLERLTQTIETLLSNGLRQSDICILVRHKNNIQRICQHFNEVVRAENESLEDIRVVSDEAFQLRSSKAIRILINALRALHNPDDLFNRASLAIYYQTDALGNNGLNTTSLFLMDSSGLDPFLPITFTAHREELMSLPLYELAERLHGIFSLGNIPDQDGYLFAFYDLLNDYIFEGPANIDNFLQAWDETLSKTTIPVGEDIDGVRIMTIHKSKGLEFHTVLVPFCDWDIKGSKNDLLWLTPKEAPFNEMPLLPAPFTSTLEDSLFKEAYNEELIRYWVDNTNLAYVAFTRAKQNLFIWGKKKKSKDKGKKDEKEKITTISSLLVLAMPDIMTPVTDEDLPEYLHTYELGEPVLTSGKVESDKDTATDRPINALAQKPGIRTAVFRYFDKTTRFLQSNASRDYIAALNGEKPDTTYIDEGVLIHQILSYVESAADLPSAIQRADNEGLFSSTLQRQNISQELSEALLLPDVQRWFSPDVHAINECNIIYRDDHNEVKECRPDRIVHTADGIHVIDYKSGKEAPEHEHQVALYMRLLSQMTGQTVRGFIWYLREQRIKEV